MSNAWDLNNILKLAGLPVVAKPLTESLIDDDYNDDDSDPDVAIADSDKRQSAFEKKNKKSISSAEKEADGLKKKDDVKGKKPDAEKKVEAKKAEPAPAKKAEEKKPVAPAKKAEPAPAKKAEAKKPAGKKTEEKKDDVTFVHGKGFVKKEEKKDDVEAKKPDAEKAPTKEEPKKEAEKEVKKVDDKKEEADSKAAPSAKKKAQLAREWLIANKDNHTRGAFRKAMAVHGISDNYANTFYYAQKARDFIGPKKPVKELYYIQHPFMHSYLLAENREMNQMQWIDSESSLAPMFFETEDEAKKIAKYMAEWRGQSSQVQKIEFED